MAYNFKNLNEIDRQDKPSENTTVMAFENGSPRQIPAGEFGGKGLVVDLMGYALNADGSPTEISDISYDPIYEAITAGQNVVFQVQIDGMDSFVTPTAAAIQPGTGFVADTIVCPILFTNGSYHTTA